MARYARECSESGIYHVMLRGIDQTQLFYDSEDREALLERLARLKDEGSFKLFAYALMGNHTHFLIKEEQDPLALSIKRLAVSYSSWFNKKYDRSGYLFQGRFKSEPIKDDPHLLTVFKYIHYNPVKVGEDISAWTSYNDYLSSSELTDTDFILGMFAKSSPEAKEQLRQFLDIPLPKDEGILGTTKP